MCFIRCWFLLNTYWAATCHACIFTLTPYLKWKKKKKDKKKAARVMSVIRMGRPLSPQQIHQKLICKRSNYHKKTSECWRRNPDTQRDAWPIWGCALMVHLGPWTAWTWDVHETPWPTFDDMLSEHMEVFPGLDLGVHMALSYGNPHLAHPLGAPPNTCWWCLLVVSVCLHSTTEQGSPNKWPLLPTHVRAEIRHWKELQSEEGKENKKERKGEPPGSIRCNRLKNSAVNANTVHLRLRTNTEYNSILTHIMRDSKRDTDA